MSKKKINIESIKKPEFKTPEGYFDNLAGKIEARIADLEPSAKEQFDLAKLPSKVPFSTPQNYFDDLPTRIQARISTQGSNQWSHLFSWTRLAWVAPAFVVLLVIGYSLVIPSSDLTKSPDELLAEVGTEDLIAYLERSELSTEDLLEQVDLASLDEEFGNINTGLLDEVELSNDDLESLFDEYDVSSDIL